MDIEEVIAYLKSRRSVEEISGQMEKDAEDGIQFTSDETDYSFPTWLAIFLETQARLRQARG